MIKWTFLVAMGVCAALLLWDGLRDGAHVLKAATTMELETSAAELLEECGYDPDRVRARGEPSDGCVAFLREHIRLASTRGNIAALVNGNGSGQICVAELLDLSDDELVRVYAG